MRMVISFLLVSGFLIIIIVSLIKDNFEFPLRITEVFGGWILAIVIFLFQSQQVEQKSKQIDIRSSAIKSLSIDSNKRDEILEFLGEKYPKIVAELINDKIIRD